MVNTVLLFANLKRNLIFYIDVQSGYSRGNLFFLPVILAFSYLILAASISFKNVMKAENKSDQRKYISMITFLILPFAGSIVQLFFYGVSLIWICVVLSLLMIFVNVQNSQISTDALTELNNRHQFDKELWRIASKGEIKKDFSLIIIDVDKFKNINDTYGHICGDRALIRVSDILKKSCKNINVFLARYGGDEFAIICQSQIVQELIEKIEKNIEDFNARKQEVFFLYLSIGFASFSDSRINSADDIITRADDNMYYNKKKKQQV